eukprot:TRINITY_DN54642_c0_g1_i1.p1 TRINITY_DN54642_c0_g1~~TRINITY_DN54642_c0_g1_i1.p1  ORF type:complete len:615 (-),score=126.21 TRINITY_DN54642_c0_g1_i1:76-1920(-)
MVTHVTAVEDISCSECFDERRYGAVINGTDSTEHPSTLSSHAADELVNQLSMLLESHFATVEEELVNRHRQTVREVTRFCAGSVATPSRSYAGEAACFPRKPVRVSTVQRTGKDHFLAPSRESSTPHMFMHRVSRLSDERASAAVDLESKLRGKRNTQPGARQPPKRPSVINSGAAAAPRAVFADPDQLKEKVKAQLLKPEYNVMDLYYETGVFQAIGRSTVFDLFTLFVIALNALWIAIDIDNNKAPSLFEAKPLFLIVENSFCLYFTFEIVVRFGAFKKKMNCIQDGWFMFDFCLVLMMVFETWIMSTVVYLMGSGQTTKMGDTSLLRLIRLLRLTRMARMVRLLRALPELLILIKGICVAARSVFFTLCLLFLVIYIFSVAFVQITEMTPRLKTLYFRSVPGAMNTLLLRATLPDMADLVEDVGNESLWIAGILLLFILFASLTLLNMLVGVLCEVVSVTSSVERERLTVRFVRAKLMDLLHKTDKDNTMSISRTEFEELLLCVEGAKIIQEVGVDPVGLVDFADFIFEDGAEITFPQFMDYVLQLRGSNVTTVKDVVDLRKFLVHSLQSTVEVLIERMQDTMDRKLKKHLQKHLAALEDVATMNGAICEA